MSRGLSILLLLCSVLVGCTKSTDTGLAAEQAQAAIDDKIISNYLAQNPGLNAKRVDAATNDTSGVYYIIKQAGTGNALFTNSTQVTLADTGKLLYNGTAYTDQIFTETNEFHPAYILSQVILGWQAGIPLCPTGGIIRLLIPSRYAYGPNAQPNIGVALGLTNGLPANAVLDFDIQIYSVAN